MSWLWWKPPCLLRTVIVNLLSERETAIRGVLWRSRGPWLVLRRCQLLNKGGEPAPMDGDIIVHRTNVSFVQVLDDADHQ